MNRLSTLPSAREQARHALLLIGAPAPARLVVQVHHALFDGDLDMPGLAALLRAERSAAAPVVCHGLTAGLAPIHLALTEWPLERRIVTPATARVDERTAIARIAEFVGMQPGASRSAHDLLRALSASPSLLSPTHSPTHSPLAQAEAASDAAVAASDAAVADFDAAVAAEAPIRAAAVRLAASRTTTEQLFGVPVVPRPRSGA